MKKQETTAWRPPTRRAFVQMLAAAAAAIALKDKAPKPELPVWIGHC
ncbi:MAG: twin-arginine translocation signal domain-containing protein [Kofleriaceae bacterium]